MKHATRFCSRHGNVYAVKPQTNHLLHLLISIVTCGAWLPIWLIIHMAQDTARYRCPRCGAALSRMPVRITL